MFHVIARSQNQHLTDSRVFRVSEQANFQYLSLHRRFLVREISETARKLVERPYQT